MHVGVLSHFGPGYSGGRIHAWFLVEALACLGHRVTVYADNRPAFLDEFAAFPGHEAIRIVCAPAFRFALPPDLDVLVCVPDLVGHWSMYAKAIEYVRKHTARFVLLSFETPNWKHAEVPTEFPVSEDYGSVEASRLADVILANSRLSRDMAQAYFTDSPAWFTYLYPPIHTATADAVPEPPQREKRILLISRFAPRYKNAHRFVELLSAACRGYEFVFIENGQMHGNTAETYRAACARVGARFRTARAVTEREKFALLKSGVLTVYPSTFEGYGLPPVESLYCGVPCLAFDLPVLREVHGDDLIYAPKGDFAAMRALLGHTLETLPEVAVDRTALRCHPFMASFTEGLGAIMERLAAMGKRRPA